MGEKTVICIISIVLMLLTGCMHKQEMTGTIDKLPKREVPDVVQELLACMDWQKELRQNPAPFYGDWKITEVVNMIENTKTEEDYLGMQISLSEEDHHLFLPQISQQEGKSVIRFYMQVEGIPFSSFIMESYDEILFITDLDTECRAERTSGEKRKQIRTRPDLTLENTIRMELLSKPYHKSYLQTLLWGRWEIEELGKTLFFYRGTDIYSEEEILEMRSFPDMTEDDIFWGITCLKKDECLFGTMQSREELGLDEVILYGMSRNNSFGESCVFVVKDSAEMFLIRENDIFHMSKGQGKPNDIRIDKLLRQWKWEWGINEESEETELEISNRQSLISSQCYYGTWQITELLEQGEEAVEGAAARENPNDMIGVEFCINGKTSGSLVCGIIHPTYVYNPYLSDEVNERNFLGIFFGNEGGLKGLGIRGNPYFAYIKFNNNQIKGIYGFAIENTSELIVLSEGGYLYRAERLNEMPHGEMFLQNLSLEECLKNNLQTYRNQGFYQNMLFRGKWGMHQCIFTADSEGENLFGQTVLFPDEEELQGYWGIIPVEETTAFMADTPTLRSMGIKGDILYYFYCTNLDWEGVFLVVDSYNMLYIKGNSIYRVKRFRQYYDAYVRDRWSG